MSVFRVEKTRDYTVMSNFHMKDKRLSLKAKGLLTQMLSLPEDWDYTLKGLSYLNKDGVDAIREAVRELERAGYVVRRRVRNDRGQLSGNEYVIYEKPREPAADSPVLENPTLEKPMQDSPAQENPTTYQVTKKSNTNKSSTYESNPYPISQDTGWEGMGYEEAKETVKENIDYEILVSDPKTDPDRLDEAVELMTEVLCSRKEKMVVAGDEYPTAMVRERLMKVTSMHIQYVFECLRRNTTYVRNIKKYMLAALFNAPATMDSYYAALVNHDEYGSCGR